MCRREGTGRGARQGAGGSGTCSARAARSLQVPMRLRGHGLRGRALRAGDSGVRVGALREQRVLPRGPRELPLPLLARCVRMRARAPGGAGAQGAVARPGMPVRVCAGAECAHVTAASLGLSFPICEAGLIIALTPGLLGAAAQSCQTFCDPMDCSLPGSSVRGIIRILASVAISFSRGTFSGSNPGLRLGRWILYH